MPRTSSSVPGLGPKLKEIRTLLGKGQAEFAELFGVNQSQLARWEGNDRPMPLSAVMQVAGIAPVEKKKEWLDAAGLVGPNEDSKRKADGRSVPILKDAAAIGTLKAAQAKEIEKIWDVPRDWLPSSGVLQAIRAPDDGMQPVIGKGYLCVVDVSARDARRLVNKIVIARDERGVYIRWLRRDLGQDILQPENRQHPLKALDARKNFGLIGEVVLWVGKLAE
jgi:transcriptional regulator with XRE-family HTH domain